MSALELEYPNIFKDKSYYNIENSRFEPAQIFSLSNLEKIVRDCTENDIYKEFSKLSAYFQKFTGYMWGNAHFLLHSDSSSSLFKFLFSSSGFITIWTLSDITLYCGEFDNVKINLAIRNFENDIIACSKCHINMVYSKNKSNRFYAGIYCEKCWIGGVKQQEARENYN
jgi:hypothetical protein